MTLNSADLKEKVQGQVQKLIAEKIAELQRRAAGTEGQRPYLTVEIGELEIQGQTVPIIYHVEGFKVTIDIKAEWNRDVKSLLQALTGAYNSALESVNVKVLDNYGITPSIRDVAAIPKYTA